MSANDQNTSLVNFSDPTRICTPIEQEKNVLKIRKSKGRT